MVYSFGTVERYLDRAEELRALSESMKDIESRELLLQTAYGYVKMAEIAARHLKREN